MKVDGQRVRAARDAKGISRERLAARIREQGWDVSESTIERIEQDRPGSPSATTVYLIAQELDVAIDSLFTEERVA